MEGADVLWVVGRRFAAPEDDNAQRNGGIT